MASNFENFKQQLDDAVELLENSGIVEKNTVVLQNTLDPLIDTKSLLSRCEWLCESYTNTKPTIRIIHHLACSGGTLFSKCISAMPNVYLLSEAHPFSDLRTNKSKPSYTPSDISMLTKHAGIPNQRALAVKLFKSAIDEVYKHVTNMGGTLVLRDHTHSDFNTNEVIPAKSVLIKLLEEDYNIASVLTIRNPIDSYASLIKNGWLHFEPSTFDEYCRRLLLLIESFEQNKIFKYEDFLANPQEQMLAITQALDLSFDDSFEYIFGMFSVTGDSGRSGDIIGERERIVSAEVLEESLTSIHYQKLVSAYYFMENSLSI
ncbi:MAG: hypothetical protein HRT54_06730 [Colwellia sp.]|nr:hypothetical protein [Colwellia sp.]